MEQPLEAIPRLEAGVQTWSPGLKLELGSLPNKINCLEFVLTYFVDVQTEARRTTFYMLVLLAEL